jgi:hypothetical protein
MAIINAFDRYKHLSELNSPLVTAEGVLTPQVRKQRVMDALSQGFTSGAGTVGAATVAAIESMEPNGDRATRLNFVNFSLGNGGDGAALGIGALAYTFPAGDFLFIDAQIKGTFSSVGLYTNALDAGLGQTIASGVVSVLGGTAEFENYIGSLTSAALPTATIVGTSGDAAANGIRNRVVLAATAHTLHVNAAGTWTDIAAASPVLFNGYAIIRWRSL